MTTRSAPETLLRAARRVLTDPRTVGVAGAAPRTVAFMARNWASTGPSVGLAAQVLLDEVLISAMRDPKLLPHGDDFRRAGDHIRAAHALWRERGWLDDPERFHIDPPAPVGAGLVSERVLGQRYAHLTFPSGYTPHDGAPGAEGWLAHAANRTMHAWVLEHKYADRPWLVCVHGFGMGSAGLDLRAFRAQQLHRDLGLNLLMPVLPLHGPRQAPGASRGEGFMSIDLVDSVHGLAQAVYDVRSCIRWIRAGGRTAPVGIEGVSLGGLVTALVASLEAGLACAIAGIPVTDLPDLYRRHSPPKVRRRAYETGALGPEARAVHSVVSPLVLKPKPARDQRYIFAGLGDRMSTAGQARRLWEHWEQPEITWYPGGHVGFWLAGNVTTFVTAALGASGLVSAPAS